MKLNTATENRLADRPFNFSPGPAALPDSVLVQASAEMLNWHGSGVSVMEMSHRGKEFISIYEQAQQSLRELLNVPPHFKILFLQGGGLGENAAIPLNLSQGKAADFVVTGAWSQKSAKEAAKYCKATVVADAEKSLGGFYGVPSSDSWQVSSEAQYLHICSNETIHGVEFQQLPDLAAIAGRDLPLVADASSHILSRTVDWTRVGVMFAGAQKNIGPAGLTLVFVREDLLGRALEICPSVMNYQVMAQTDSMFNTPPTYAIYIAGLVFQWIKAQGGVAEMERRAIEKSKLLYQCIDASDGFYINRVAVDSRSRMNVTFFLKNENLNDLFLTNAKERGLINLKGHKSVGGMRASIYNAVPVEGAYALADYMKSFAQQHG